MGRFSHIDENGVEQWPTQTVNGLMVSKMPTCGAPTQKGKPCRLKPEPGDHRCRLHGGVDKFPHIREERLARQAERLARRPAKLKRQRKKLQRETRKWVQQHRSN